MICNQPISQVSLTKPRDEEQELNLILPTSSAINPSLKSFSQEPRDEKTILKQE
jgi:hypothetical protein